MRDARILTMKKPPSLRTLKEMSFWQELFLFMEVFFNKSKFSSSNQSLRFYFCVLINFKTHSFNQMIQWPIFKAKIFCDRNSLWNLKTERSGFFDYFASDYWMFRTLQALYPPKRLQEHDFHKLKLTIRSRNQN